MRDRPLRSRSLFSPRRAGALGRRPGIFVGAGLETRPYGFSLHAPSVSRDVAPDTPHCDIVQEKPQTSKTEVCATPLLRGKEPWSENELVGKVTGGGGGPTGGTDPSFAICAAKVGALLFTLKPIKGAVAGTAEYAQVRFAMDGEYYTLYSATPIAGGPQPTRIWVLRLPGCGPNDLSLSHYPFYAGNGSIREMLKFLRETPKLKPHSK